MTHIEGIYAIADSAWKPRIGYVELVERFLRGGAKVVQLRMKDAAKADVLREAKAIATLKREYNFTFIVNDHSDVAVDCGADGVHIGKNDSRIEQAKKMCGDKLVVGFSSHSIDEAIAAADAGASYVAFGAIFPTKTKGPGHPVQGVEKLREVVRSVKVPVVAIGGIGRGNIRDVVRCGATSVAMISALCSVHDIEAETRHFVGAFGEARKEAPL